MDKYEKTVCVTSFSGTLTFPDCFLLQSLELGTHRLKWRAHAQYKRLKTDLVFSQMNFTQ